MKKQYLIILIFCLTFLGCEDDLLNKSPITTLNPETFWNNADEAEMAVNALYTYLPNIFQIYFDNKTEISIVPSASGNLIVMGQVMDTDQELLSWWRSHYRAVSAANRFIEDVDLVPAQEISDDMLARLKAEARFIRALSYTFLVNYFGDVPFFTHELSLSEASNITRTDKQVILDFIETELTQIADDLPQVYGEDDKGRISKGAALAWKARAMLWSKQYQKAADAAKAVMDLGIYRLHPDYAELFTYSGEYQNEEVILEYIYTNVTGHNFMLGAAPYEFTSGVDVLSVNPTRILVDEYETINGLAPAADPDFDTENPYNNRDPRLKATIWLPVFKDGSYSDILWGATKPFDVRPGSGTRDEVFSTNRGNKTGFLLKKYTNEEDLTNITNSSQNYLILRYADVLLMYAEAKIELGQIDASVIQAINAVRTRVTLPALEEKGVNVNDQAEMREAVRHERLVELAMEGWRFYDIRRWDIAQDLLKDSEPAPGIKYRDILTGELNSVNVTDVNWNYQKKNEGHTFPVPWDEYNMNLNLLPQNEGW